MCALCVTVGLHHDCSLSLINMKTIAISPTHSTSRPHPVAVLLDSFTTRYPAPARGELEIDGVHFSHEDEELFFHAGAGEIIQAMSFRKTRSGEVYIFLTNSDGPDEIIPVSREQARQVFITLIPGVGDFVSAEGPFLVEPDSDEECAFNSAGHRHLLPDTGEITIAGLTYRPDSDEELQTDGGSLSDLSVHTRLMQTGDETPGLYLVRDENWLKTGERIMKTSEVSPKVHGTGAGETIEPNWIRKTWIVPTTPEAAANWIVAVHVPKSLHRAVRVRALDSFPVQPAPAA